MNGEDDMVPHADRDFVELPYDPAFLGVMHPE
jgi:hypothetical protein